MQYRKGKPYIRRAHPKDGSESLRIAFRMAFYQEVYGDYYVLVQHGFPHQVIDAGRTKRDIAKSIVPVWAGWLTFKQWQRRVHRDTGFGKYG